MGDSRILALRAGELALELAPSQGGGILAFRRGAVDLMRPTKPADLAAGAVRQFASWPLVPYSNRIRNGRFAWRGRAIQLPTDATDPHAIHGVGWRRPWTVRDASESAVCLDLVHAQDASWPFAFSAQQCFALDADGFELWMSVTNTGTEPMPAGLGPHPYFPRDARTTLAFAATHAFENDAEKIPLRLVKVPQALDFSTAKPVDAHPFDTVFLGWKGPVRIAWPQHRLGLTLTADEIFNRLVVYVPPGEKFFAIETVTHDTDALNRPGDTGMVALAPGDSLAGSMRYTVEELS